ncbi:hypothetical protein PYCC9005_002666 [Savitreella phatthalungensis]
MDVDTLGDLLDRLDGLTSREAIAESDGFYVQKLRKVRHTRLRIVTPELILTEHQNLDYAHTLLIDVERQTKPSRPLKLERTRVEKIAERLAERQAELLDVAEAAAAAAEAEEKKHAEKAATESSDAQSMQNLVDSERPRDALFGSLDAEKRSEEKVLEDDRETQDRISEELLEMARALRASQVKFGEAITKDNALIDKVGEALSQNAGKMTSAGKRLGKYSKTSSGTTWLSFGAIAVVFLSIFLMIPIIKLT